MALKTKKNTRVLPILIRQRRYRFKEAGRDSQIVVFLEPYRGSKTNVRVEAADGNRMVVSREDLWDITDEEASKFRPKPGKNVVRILPVDDPKPRLGVFVLRRASDAEMDRDQDLAVVIALNEEAARDYLLNAVRGRAEKEWEKMSRGRRSPYYDDVSLYVKEQTAAVQFAPWFQRGFVRVQDAAVTGVVATTMRQFSNDLRKPGEEDPDPED